MTTTNNDIKKYLITEAVDIKQLSEDKLSEDLKLLEHQEKKTTAKTDISRSTGNVKLSRIMKALQISNPFKGY